MSPLHNHHALIYVLIFIILLVSMAWMYNIQVSEVMQEKVKRIDRQKIETIYSSNQVKLSEEQRLKIESIYGKKKE